MFDGRDVAAKTGSSDGWKDRWTVAYTPSISVAVWLGDRANRMSWGGANTTNYVVYDILNNYLRGTPYEKFPSYTPPVYNNAYNEEQAREMAKKMLDKAPKVVGQTLSKAMKTLEGYAVLYVKDYHATAAKDTVFKQEIDTAGKQLILYVSKGPRPSG